MREDADTSLFAENGVWDVRETRVSTGVLEQGIQYLVVELDIKRRASFYLVNMLLPIGAMGVLNLLVFLLPAESGERVGYSITLLLAIAVFLTIAADNLPKTSYPTMSVLVIKLLVDMMISSLVMFFTIIGLRFYHTDESSPVPGCVAATAKVLLCKCCCNRRKIKQNRGSRINNGLDHKIPNGVGHHMPYYIETRHHNDGFHNDSFDQIGQGSYENDIGVYKDGKLPRIYLDDDEPNKDYTEERDEKITWKDVGKASDVFFFCLTLFAFGASHLAYFIYLNII